MTAPIALQLYTVRQALQKDFTGVVEEIAEMGYMGVETAGFPGTLFPGVSPTEAGELFHSLGLKVPSAHAPLPLGDRKSEVLEAMEALRCRHLVCPWMDPKHYASIETIKELAGLFNDAHDICRANGLRFSSHNHWAEMENVDGTPAYQILLEYLDPEVLLQVDTYWAQVAGLDPAAVVAELGARTPLLHIKDGPATRDGDMTAVGDGVVDIAAIIAAGRPHTEWLIVEIDRCGTDMMEAVAGSYSFLTSGGLARGRR
jgi:sugar phosphate isomerase/epimerase